VNDLTGPRAARAPAPPLPPIAVTLGDPRGIGPDITLAGWCARLAHALHPFAVYGDPDVLRDRARTLGLDVPVAAIARLGEASGLFGEALPVLPLLPAPGGSAPSRGREEDQESARDRGIVAAIEAAVDAALRGEALALVTNPIAKRSLSSVALDYPGHTAFLGKLAARWTGRDAIRPVMMLASDELKVVPATVHIALAAVPRMLTQALIVETARITARALEEDFGLARARLAVAGLNPHAGEEGLIGSEEAKLIVPAIAQLRAEGLTVTGPHSADSMFHAEARAGYDAALAMYHDQALIPLKTLAFDRGVNVTLGLPFVRTSPDHGTAFALAGTGTARPDSFIAALRLAAELGGRRAARRVTARQ
jgi:4-hydroxythreonine-4-phosphate dehydrogenase